MIKYTHAVIIATMFMSIAICAYADPPPLPDGWVYGWTNEKDIKSQRDAIKSIQKKHKNILELDAFEKLGDFKIVNFFEMPTPPYSQILYSDIGIRFILTKYRVNDPVKIIGSTVEVFLKTHEITPGDNSAIVFYGELIIPVRVDGL